MFIRISIVVIYLGLLVYFVSQPSCTAFNYAPKPEKQFECYNNIVLEEVMIGDKKYYDIVDYKNDYVIAYLVSAENIYYENKLFITEEYDSYLKYLPNEDGVLVRKFFNGEKVFEQRYYSEAEMPNKYSIQIKDGKVIFD